MCYVVLFNINKKRYNNKSPLMNRPIHLSPLSHMRHIEVSDEGGGCVQHLLDRDDMWHIRQGTFAYTSFHRLQVEAAAMELWIRFNNRHSRGTNHNQDGNDNKNDDDNDAKLAGGDDEDAMDLLGTWLKEYREDLDPLLDLGTRRDRYGAMMMMHGHAADDDRDDSDDHDHGVALTSMSWLRWKMTPRFLMSSSNSSQPRPRNPELRIPQQSQISDTELYEYSRTVASPQPRGAEHMRWRPFG